MKSPIPIRLFERHKHSSQVVCAMREKSIYRYADVFHCERIAKITVGRDNSVHCDLSVGSFGCNLRYIFCQNQEISMSGDRKMETVEVSQEALACKAPELRPYAISGRPYPTTSR